MFVTEQLIDFSQFILIGMLLAIIFDFFRAYRKYKKVSTFWVIVHDILYFILATSIVVIGVIFILDSSIRLHIFLAMIIGFMLYISLLSKYIIKIYISFFYMFHTIVDILITPIKLLIQIFQKIWSILKKIIRNCCKKFSGVLLFLCKPMNKMKDWLKIIFTIKKKRTKEV